MTTQRTVTTEQIRPLVSDTLETPDGMRLTAACFGGKDWSLKSLQEPGNERDNSLAGRLGKALSGLDAYVALAPTPTEFNGRIIPPGFLSDQIRLGHGVNMFRNTRRPADGTMLVTRGTAGIFSGGGCSAIVAAYKDQAIFAHAGRDCVLDRTRVRTNGREQGRPFESVVDSIIRTLGLDVTEDYNNLHAWVLWSIKPGDFAHRFDNRQHSQYNTGAAVYVPRLYGGAAAYVDDHAVYLDVPEIVQSQFMQYGVPDENIDLTHAYLADELPHTRKDDGDGRYLVAVVRHT